jgi:heme-degrading monooxygenase HmoA
MHRLVSAGIGATALSPKVTASLPGSPAPAAAALVALRRFDVAKGTEAEVKAAFRECLTLVDRVAGFVCMEWLCSLERPREIWLVAHWRHACGRHAWHHGHADRDSHRSIPKDLKLVDRDTSHSRIRPRLGMMWR